jgi:protein tyrosine phosphatase
MEKKDFTRDYSQEYIARHSELQFCELSIPYKEFYYHSQARDKILEFKIIKKITETKKHAEMLVENLGDCLYLNRYPDILPYKDTLILPSNLNYINSSLIDGIGTSNKGMFIATQGPKESTLNSFWQLIWDYNVPLIIMGCNLVENEIEKCFEYFPKDGKINAGTFEIFLVKTEQKYPNLTQRVLMICHAASQSYKTLIHIHCTAWPDLMVPSITEEFHSISYLLNKIEKKWNQTKGKILVHCSAGVGRTGVVIAIYNMVTEIKAEGTLSVFKTVRLLREQRWGMVANEDQYLFIYQFMEYWISYYLISNSL